jgi:hypothetical protein
MINQGEAKDVIYGRGTRAGLLWSTPHTFIHSGGKGRPARKADNLSAICVPTV